MQAIVALASVGVDEGGIDIKDRKYHLKMYEQCFTGRMFVDWLLKNNHCENAEEAVALGNDMIKANLLMHVCRDHQFKNEDLFFRFVALDKDHGHVPEGHSWHNVAEIQGKEFNMEGLKEVLSWNNSSDLVQKNQSTHIPDMLFDKYNCDMFDNVRPINWVDPVKHGNKKYDILVIGGGAGGIITAAGAAGLGARACLIERAFMGGDCLVTGCVPSKAFLKAASVVKTVKTSEEYGVKIKGEVEIDFPKLMERMKKVRAQISENDRAKRFTDTYGIDIYLGHAKFINKTTVEVNGQHL